MFERSKEKDSIDKDSDNFSTDFMTKNTEGAPNYYTDYKAAIVKNDKEKGRLKKFLYSPITIGIVVFLIGVSVTYQQSNAEIIDVFNKDMNENVKAVEEEVAKYNKLLTSFSLLIDGSGNFNAPIFYKYANNLIDNEEYPSLIKVDYISYEKDYIGDVFYNSLKEDYNEMKSKGILNKDDHGKLIDIIARNKVINEKKDILSPTNQKLLVKYTFPLGENIQTLGDEYQHMEKQVFEKVKDKETFGSYTYRKFIEDNAEKGVYRTNILKRINNGTNNGGISFTIELSNDLFQKTHRKHLNDFNYVIYSSPKDGRRLVYDSLPRIEREKILFLKPTVTDSQFIKIGNEEYEMRMSSYQRVWDNTESISGVLMSLAGSLFTVLMMIMGKKRAKTENKEDTVAFEEMEEQLRLDDLTKLLNRRACLKDLQALISKYKSNINEMKLLNNQSVSVIFIDLDGFKRINDTLGHSYGDYVLIEYSKRLKGLLHNIENTAIYRLGGDEFTVVLDNHSIDDIELMVEQILDLTKDPFYLREENYYVTQSMGVASFPTNAWTADMLLKNADMAMYEAKRAGKNCCVFFNQKISEVIDKKNKVVNNINEAIEKEEFYMVYQPKFRLVSKGKYNCSGVEALIRWESEKLGNVKPDVFIPIIEEHGLISETTNWILKKICEEYQAFKNLQGFRVSINLSAKQLGNLNLAKELYEIIRKNDLRPEQFVIEITETTMMREPEIAKVGLQKFKKLGFLISVDDFGTGYSSLSYLRQFPVDEVKIDKTFTDMVLTDHHTQVIVEGIISMSKKLNINIVVEGVETLEQVKWIEDHSSPEQIIELQGYYFSKPLNIKDLKAFFK